MLLARAKFQAYSKATRSNINKHLVAAFTALNTSTMASHTEKDRVVGTWSQPTLGADDGRCSRAALAGLLRIQDCRSLGIL